MSSKADKRLMPELRFPQFLGAGDWDAKPLHDVTNLLREKIKSDEVAAQNYVSTENLLSEFSGVFRATKLPSTGNVTRFRTGDILVSNIRPYLKKIWVATFDGGASNDVIVVRAKSPIHKSFLSAFLMSDIFISYVMAGAKGVKMPRGDIALIEKFPVPVPRTTIEQRKIADCLSSLDDLITAQAQKLETLKAHKKGLMQQLFPVEGKTVPHLRFPEFLDAGEWKEMRLGNMLKETVRSIKMSDEQNYGLVTVKRRYGGIVLRDIRKGKSIKVKTQFLLQENDFLISKRQIIHNACGLVPKEFEGSIVSNEYSILKPRKNCNIEYINWFSQHPKMSESFRLSSRGIVIEKMLFDLDDWLKRKFLFPSLPEQQKIADCLCSLTDLITAHTQKLDALKTFKKGLMQRLFPSTFEGEA